MIENKNNQKTTISKANTLEEISDFWDTHSLDDYWEQTHEVEFEVRAKRRRRIVVDPEIYEKINENNQKNSPTPSTRSVRIQSSCL